MPSETIDQPAPYALAMLICDAIHTDPSTGKKTVLGIFSVILGRRFPLRFKMMALYVAMTDGRGLTPIRIRLVDGDEERPPIFEATNKVDFTDPWKVVELTLTMKNIAFHVPGEYRLQLFASDTLLMERKLFVSTRPRAPKP